MQYFKSRNKMLNKIQTTVGKTFITVCSGLILNTASALEITSGQFIQTVYTEELEASSTFIVNDFFNEEAMVGRLRADIIEDIVLGPAPLSTNQFSYTVHGPDFVPGHPNRNPGINSFPSNFEFDTADVLQSATSGRIGLGGVMRFNLPSLTNGTPRYFMLGDWTLEYDASRKEDYNFADNVNKPIHPADFDVSGWFMRNHFDIPAIGFEVLKQTIFTNDDSFYFSGELAWAPEMVTAFFPETELYRTVSGFVMCAQDDNALANHSVQMIPCVFPNITLNGQATTVHLDVGEEIKLAADLGVATTENHLNADYFVAFEYEGTLYWLNKDFQWTTAMTSAHQGPLVDFRAISLPSPVAVTGAFPSGTTIPVYFGVDTTQNGVFDEPYRFSRVTLHIN